MSEKKNLNLFQKLSAISQEIGVIQKDLTVEQKSGKSYTAVSERMILDKVKPLEEKYGVFSYPGNRTVSSRTENRPYYSNGERRTFPVYIIDLAVDYHFVNVDNPTEEIVVASYGTGMDTGDKAPGKAMTYADKYALMKAYKISTGDDPDANASPEDPSLMVGDTVLIPTAMCSTDQQPEPKPADSGKGKRRSSKAAAASENTEAKTAAESPAEPAAGAVDTEPVPAVQAPEAPELPRFTKDEAQSFIVDVGMWSKNPITLGELYGMNDDGKRKVTFFATNPNTKPLALKAAAMTLLGMPY